MGNNPSTGIPNVYAHQISSAHVTEEPLESFRRESERNGHLKNLGFKRGRSLRRSISRKLRVSRKSLNNDTTDGEKKKELETSSNDEQKPKETPPVLGQPEPFPSHVQNTSSVSGDFIRASNMDKIRKSFRSSMRRKRNSRSGNSGGVKSNLWQTDDAEVRSGICSFYVKYLGCVEVFESRGMQVCEEAVKVLKHSKRKAIRSVLYVHGDGLKVVDDETKGLIVDQTIEKVSFCAPDRNFENGFSYICRDGATRRWMCHGFMAIKESGERLSHAVGCAFAVCLEKKQQRDKECNVSMTFDNSNSSFTRLGSFRHGSITERLTDPQGIKPNMPALPSCVEVNPFAVARPHATDLMLQRQTSFRGFNQTAAGQSPFKRQLSLRLSELPSTLERLKVSSSSALNENQDVKVDCVPAINLSNEDNQRNKLDNGLKDKMSNASIVGGGLPSLVEVEDDGSEEEKQQNSTNFDLGNIHTLHSKQCYNLWPHQNFHRHPRNVLPSVPECDPKDNDVNLWDFVPDQPNNLKVASSFPPTATNVTNSDSESAFSFCDSDKFMLNSTGPPVEEFESLSSAAPSTAAAEEWLGGVMSSASAEGSLWNNSILDDPFDAEWAALATRNNYHNEDDKAKVHLHTDDKFNHMISAGEIGNTTTNPFQNGIRTIFEVNM